LPVPRVNPARVTSAQFWQAVLLLKLKISYRSRRKQLLSSWYVWNSCENVTPRFGLG